MSQFAMVMSGFAGAVFMAALTDAAVADIKAYRIPDRDSLLLVAAFAAAVPGLELGWQAMAWHVAASGAVFALGAVLFAFKLWGGGDAKLVAAVTLLTGFEGLPRFLLVMALAGGMLALILLASRKFTAKESWGARMAASGHVPYGVAIALGGVDWAMRELLPRFWG